MIDIELTDPVHVTVGFVGEPGARVFYLQAADEHLLVSITLEKQQVAAVGELLGQLLARLGEAPVTDWDRRRMALREPVQARWRAGAIEVGLDPDQGRFLLELEELVPDEVGDPRELRIIASTDQVRHLAAHAAEIVTQGRPPCPLCGRPMAGDGAHVCPATNGHGALTR